MKDDPVAFRRGDVWRDHVGEIKIMAYVDGYVLARRKHCIPFVEIRREFLKRWTFVRSGKK